MGLFWWTLSPLNGSQPSFLTIWTNERQPSKKTQQKLTKCKMSKLCAILTTCNENIHYSNYILINFQVFAASEVNLIFYDPWFFQTSPISAGIARKMSVFQIQADRWEWSNFLQETAHGALPPPKSGQVNFWKHKCGHNVNNVMAFHAKAPDDIENMLQLYLK